MANVPQCCQLQRCNPDATTLRRVYSRLYLTLVASCLVSPSEAAPDRPYTRRVTLNVME